MALAQEEADAGIPEWVVTFGDMMSLLLTFFVLLFSMSEVKKEESQMLLESLRKRFGHERSAVAMVPGPVAPMNSAVAKLGAMGRARRFSTMNGGDKVQAVVGDYPRVRTVRPGEESTTGGVIRFAEGSADLSHDERRALRQTAAVLGGKPHKIEVRGHTTARPLPPESPYRNHWDLAYARTWSIMDELIRLGIDPRRFRLDISAANEPVDLEPNSADRARNARVEVVMLDELTEDLQGTAEERRQRYSSGAMP